MFSKHYHLSFLKLDEIVMIIGSQDLQKIIFNYTCIYKIVFIHLIYYEHFLL